MCIHAHTSTYMHIDVCIRDAGESVGNMWQCVPAVNLGDVEVEVVGAAFQVDVGEPIRGGTAQVRQHPAHFTVH